MNASFSRGVRAIISDGVTYEFTLQLAAAEEDYIGTFKNKPRYYILYKPDLTALEQLTHADFKTVHVDYWKIECFHRVIKQVCNIERFYVQDEKAIRNHFFCVLSAFCKLQTICIRGYIDNCYKISRQLFVPVIRQFILENLTSSMFAQ